MMRMMEESKLTLMGSLNIIIYIHHDFLFKFIFQGHGIKDKKIYNPMEKI